MIPLCDERAAAVNILERELGFKDNSKDTAGLWEIITANTDSYAASNPENILNDTKPWAAIKNDIKHCRNTDELMSIYKFHTKLQNHKQFLKELTKQKLKVK